MAERAGLLQPESTAALGASSSRESSPEEHVMTSLTQHSMDSLIMSGESSDDVILDDLDDEEIAGSGEEDDYDGPEAIADTDAGILNTMVEDATDQSTTSGDSTAAGDGSSSRKKNAAGGQTRGKAKRRISRARERKISISSSRLKVNKSSMCMYCVCCKARALTIHD